MPAAPIHPTKMQKNLRKFREAASLIVAARQQHHQNQSHADGFDYKILTMKRTPQTSFFSGTLVFPGGAIDTADSSPEWLSLFESFGFSSKLLATFRERESLPPIMRDNGDGKGDAISRCLSLRISAIREAFEETGLLLCKSHADRSRTPKDLAELFGGSRMQEWQHQVHTDPTIFIKLCRELGLYPDVWALKDWSNWITPVMFPKRYDTIFFIATLNEVPPTFAERTEAEELLWLSPAEYLRDYRDGKCFLPPPQIYEFSRLLNFTELSDLSDFAGKRDRSGCLAYLPVAFKSGKSIFTVLPGDDLYPENPDVTEVEEEPAQASTRLHRIVNLTKKNCQIQIANFEAHCGHKHPIALRDQSKL